MRPPSRLCIDPLKKILIKKNFENFFLKKTRTYEMSQTRDRVHLGHLKKKKLKKKLKKYRKKIYKVENQNITHGRGS